MFQMWGIISCTSYGNITCWFECILALSFWFWNQVCWKHHKPFIIYLDHTLKSPNLPVGDPPIFVPMTMPAKSGEPDPFSCNDSHGHKHLQLYSSVWILSYSWLKNSILWRKCKYVIYIYAHSRNLTYFKRKSKWHWVLSFLVWNVSETQNVFCH